MPRSICDSISKSTEWPTLTLQTVTHGSVTSTQLSKVNIQALVVAYIPGYLVKIQHNIKTHRKWYKKSEHKLINNSSIFFLLSVILPSYSDWWKDSQPAAIFILDGSLENSRHVGDGNLNAFTCYELKLTPPNRQVMDLQAERAKVRRGHYYWLFILARIKEQTNKAMATVLTFNLFLIEKIVLMHSSNHVLYTLSMVSEYRIKEEHVR